jgi:hypothetical protein
MHLHLGSPASRELVYLIQYPKRVVLLEVSDHYHLDEEPVGGQLSVLHANAISQNAQSASDKANAVVLKGLLPRKPR